MQNRLPNRRMQFTKTIEWNEQECFVSYGFNYAGKVAEVFLDGLKVGSALDALIDDCCVALSLLMRAGYTIGEIDKHLGREGNDSFAPAASLLGLIVKVGSEVERKEGVYFRGFYDITVNKNNGPEVKTSEPVPSAVGAGE